MTAKLSWQDSKQAGNDLFKRGEWLKSAAQYSAAIKAFDGAPEDLAVLHSNRCAALLKMSKVTRALADATRCIELRPDWDKGYFRKGSALEAVSDLQGALEVYQEGLRRSPENREMSLKAARIESQVKQARAKQKATDKHAAAKGGPEAASG